MESRKKELLEKIRAKKELELGYSNYDIPNYNNGKEDFLSFFENNIKFHNDSAVLEKFKEFIGYKNNDEFPFNKIDERLCEGFRDYLLGKVSHNSAWNYFSVFKKFLNIAVKQKYLVNNPAKYVKISVQETERIYLTFDELKKLTETDFYYMDLKDAFIFSCFTGLRYSDVRDLRWEQIKENKLFFRQKKTKGIEYLPLNESALKIISKLRKTNFLPEDKIFKVPHRGGKVGEKIREWGKLAKINKHLTYHVSRHTFATLSITYGIDLFTLSKLMGHKSIK